MQEKAKSHLLLHVPRSTSPEEHELVSSITSLMIESSLLLLVSFGVLAGFPPSFLTREVSGSMVSTIVTIKSRTVVSVDDR